MAEVVLEQVSKRYETGVAAVEDVSLSIADGEFLVLVGPSGCGKSTTLRMIAGLEEITSGSIYIGGRRVNEVPPKDRDIAMVFQNYALYPHMTVYENMAFGLRLRGLRRGVIDERVREAAEILGLSELLTRVPKQLSGGQRQRVAVGRAIVRKPRVFLFDEPLSNLDAKMRVEMRGEISRLHRRLGATMVYVTHDQAEAMTMGDRIAVMNRGTVQQVDAPLAVYRRPANLFVAGFIGMPPMNVLRGRVSDGGDRFAPTGGEAFAVPARQRDALAEFAGRELLLGVRPEAAFEADGAAACATVRGFVDVVEPMGAETFVHVVVADGGRVIARVSPEAAVAPGTETAVSFGLERAVFYDADTGRAVDA